MTGDTFTITGTIEFTKIVHAPENDIPTIELAEMVKRDFPNLSKSILANLFDDARVTELKVFPAEAATEAEPEIEEEECEACKIDLEELRKESNENA